MARLTAGQAVEGMPRSVTAAQIVDALVGLGMRRDVAGAVTSVRLDPDRGEVTVALLAEAGAPRLTMTLHVVR